VGGGGGIYSGGGRNFIRINWGGGGYKRGRLSLSAGVGEDVNENEGIRADIAFGLSMEEADILGVGGVGRGGGRWKRGKSRFIQSRGEREREREKFIDNQIDD
jgi:hypothetical protein